MWERNKCFKYFYNCQLKDVSPGRYVIGNVTNSVKGYDGECVMTLVNPKSEENEVIMVDIKHDYLLPLRKAILTNSIEISQLIILETPSVEGFLLSKYILIPYNEGDGHYLYESKTYFYEEDPKYSRYKGNSDDEYSDDDVIKES